MKFSAPCVAIAALLLAAPSLRAQAPPECREDFRGSRAARRAHEDSVSAARDTIQRAMAEDIRVAVRAAGVAEPAGLVVVATDSAMRPVITPVDINFPVDALREVAPKLLDRAGTVPGTGLTCVGLVLRLDTLPRAAGSTADVPPRMVNAIEVRGLMERWIETHPNVGQRTALMTFIVTRDGTVLLPRIRKSSGLASVDEFVTAVTGMMKFAPASEGAVLTDVFVMQPIVMVPNSRRPEVEERLQGRSASDAPERRLP